MNLTTDPKTSIIIFHDKSNIFISEEQKNTLYSEPVVKSGKIIIDDQMYSLSSMSKVLSLDEFYRQYPDKAPEYRKEFNVEDVIPMTEEQLRNMRRGVMKGLKQFIDEEVAKGGKPVKAKEIYDNRLNNYKLLYQIGNNF